MPRSRAKLSDKQERILVQAQLMGLTARDMQQIGNRLIALQKEAEEKLQITQTIEGYLWNQDKDGRWTIITSEGYHCRFSKGIKTKQYHWESSRDYQITITKPGTAFQTRNLKKNSISIRDEWKAKFCPENSKELYGMIKFLNAHLTHLVNKK
jgi:hypothetical protein